MGNGQSPSFYGVVITGTNMPAGQWTHVAFSVFTSPGQLNPSYATLYVNGVGFNATWKTGERQLLKDSPIQLGSYVNQDPDVKWWRGYMDEIRFWSVYRSVDQIRSTMSITLDPAIAGLLAYYRCDAGSVLVDANRKYDGQFVASSSPITYVLSGVSLGFEVATDIQTTISIELIGSGTSPFIYIIASLPNSTIGGLNGISNSMLPYSLSGNTVTFTSGNIVGQSTSFTYYGSNTAGREAGSTKVTVRVDQPVCNPDACGVCGGNGSSCTCLDLPYKGYEADELEKIVLIYEMEQTLNLLDDVERKLEQSIDSLDSHSPSQLPEEITEVQDFQQLCLSSFSDQLDHFLNQ